LTRLRGLRVAALTALLATACASPRPFTDDLENKPWDALKTLLPPYPKDDRLIPFSVDPSRPFAFFVDRDSINVVQDGPLRYTLVARSSSGASNVSYEAIRCETLERRTYAFGRTDGTWAQARNPQWLPIDRSQPNQQMTLANDFLCTAPPLRTADEAVQALTRRNSPSWLR